MVSLGGSDTMAVHRKRHRHTQQIEFGKASKVKVDRLIRLIQESRNKVKLDPATQYPDIEQVQAKCSAFCCFLAVAVQKLKFLNNSIEYREYRPQGKERVYQGKTGRPGRCPGSMLLFFPGIFFLTP
jgi:hypothetical protein